MGKTLLTLRFCYILACLVAKIIQATAPRPDTRNQNTGYGSTESNGFENNNNGDGDFAVGGGGGGSSWADDANAAATGGGATGGGSWDTGAGSGGW